MPILNYTPGFFGKYWGKHLTAPSYIEFTWAELCKAAITVGRRSWKDVLLYGNHSAFEILWRLAMLRSNLVEDAAGYLRPSKAFEALDPSEKGAVSFFLGMCFSKLIVEKLFGVPWLLHLDVYRSTLNPRLAFKTRPDFVGIDANQQWIVVESKGRSWSLPNKTMAKAKEQTRSLRNINGELPVLKVAIGSCFSTKKMNAKLWDPEEYDENAEDLEIDSNQLIRAYYSPIVEYAKLQSLSQAVLNDIDANIVLDESVLAWYESSDSNFWDRVVTPEAESKDSLLTLVGDYKRNLSQVELTLEQNIPELPKIDDDLEKNIDFDKQKIVERHTNEEERTQVNLIRKKKIKELIEIQRVSNIGLAVDGVNVELGVSWTSKNMRRQPQNR